MKAYSTIITATNKLGQLEVFDGPPIFAIDRAEADSACERLFPYAKVVEEDVNLDRMTATLFEPVD